MLRLSRQRVYPRVGEGEASLDFCNCSNFILGGLSSHMKALKIKLRILNSFSGITIGVLCRIYRGWGIKIGFFITVYL